MNRNTLAKRVELLEREMAAIKKSKSGTHLTSDQPSTTWHDVFGAFAGDPDFRKAMQIGAAYRRSLRPKNTRRKTPKA